MSYLRASLSEAEFHLAWRLRAESWEPMHQDDRLALELDVGPRMRSAYLVLVTGKTRGEALAGTDLTLNKVSQICEEVQFALFGSKEEHPHGRHWRAGISYSW